MADQPLFSTREQWSDKHGYLTRSASLFLEILTRRILPLLSGNPAEFLDGSGAFTTPPTGMTQLTGDVTAGPGSGSQAATIANDAVTNAKLANMADATVKLREVGAGTGNPIDGDADALSDILDTAADPFVRTSAAGGGGGDSSYTAAYGSRPAASNDGDLFLPNNGVYLERDTGAAWVPWGPLFPFTAPVDGDFSWTNQGGASVVTTQGGIYLLAPANAGASLRIRRKAAPSTPYTITAAFAASILNLSNQRAGLCFRQSSDGKLVIFYLLATNAAFTLQTDKFTNETTGSATYSSIAANAMRGPVVFLRIADNGTNRICSYSTDGQNWIQIHSVGRTDFLTADQVGFFVSEESNSVAAGMTLLSWKEA